MRPTAGKPDLSTEQRLAAERVARRRADKARDRQRDRDEKKPNEEKAR